MLCTTGGRATSERIVVLVERASKQKQHQFKLAPVSGRLGTDRKTDLKPKIRLLASAGGGGPYRSKDWRFLVAWRNQGGSCRAATTPSRSCGTPDPAQALVSNFQFRECLVPPVPHPGSQRDPGHHLSAARPATRDAFYSRQFPDPAATNHPSDIIASSGLELSSRPESRFSLPWTSPSSAACCRHSVGRRTGSAGETPAARLPLASCSPVEARSNAPRRPDPVLRRAMLHAPIDPIWRTVAGSPRKEKPPKRSRHSMNQPPRSSGSRLCRGTRSALHRKCHDLRCRR